MTVPKKKTAAEKKAAAEAKRERRAANKAATTESLYPDLEAGKEAFTPPAEGADAPDLYAHLGSNASVGDEKE